MYIGRVDFPVVVVSAVLGGVGTEVVDERQTQLSTSSQMNGGTWVNRLAIVVVCTRGELTRARKVDSSRIHSEQDVSDSIFVGVDMRR